MFNSIENPLAEGDSYEIVTPDGVMAVRGTQFRVAVGASPDGNARETRVSVLERTVHVQLNNHAQDQTSLTAGQEAIIEGDWEQDDACYFQTAGEAIDLDTVLEYLKEDVEKVLAQESEVNSETIPSPSPIASSAPIAQHVVTATPAPTPVAEPTPARETQANVSPVQPVAPAAIPAPTAAPTPTPTPTPTPEPPVYYPPVIVPSESSEWQSDSSEWQSSSSESQSGSSGSESGSSERQSPALKNNGMEQFENSDGTGEKTGENSGEVPISEAAKASAAAPLFPSVVLEISALVYKKRKKDD